MAGIAPLRRQVGRYADTWRSRRAPSSRFSFGKAWALFVTCTFILGIVICGPAEHAALETETQVASQIVMSSVQAPAWIKTAGDQKTPIKRTLTACTGHCSAHGISLPVSFAPEMIAFEHRAVWLAEPDVGLLIDRSVLLERPPRA